MKPITMHDELFNTEQGLL